MNLVLWIIAGLLALAFLLGGCWRPSNHRRVPRFLHDERRGSPGERTAAWQDAPLKE